MTDGFLNKYMDIEIVVINFLNGLHYALLETRHLSISLEFIKNG